MRSTVFYRLSWLFCFCMLLVGTTHGKVILPKLVSDGMVLQQKSPVKIWGWASANEDVKVLFINKEYLTKADENGEWVVIIPEMQAGGPFDLYVVSHDTIKVKDILIGDVWLCSGQSNMDLPMRRVQPLYHDEIKSAHNPNIRYFAVPRASDLLKQKNDFSNGQWVSVNCETIEDFSAVAYFFAKSVYEKTNIPIGLIQSSYGGSPVETWMSENYIRQFPKHYNETVRCRDTVMVSKVLKEAEEKSSNWYNSLYANDLGYKTGDVGWFNPDVDCSDWNIMNIPGYWNDNGLPDTHGVVWYRKLFDVPNSMVGKSVKLNLGRIVDSDSVFFNGKFVGSVGYQYPPRWYTIPEGILKKEKNTIVVRIINTGGNGGFVPDYPYELTFNNDTVNLKGQWKFKLGVSMPTHPGGENFKFKPTGLFNGMIHPLLKYNIKGIIWYQGESNVGRPDEYADLFPAFIKDIRSQFGQGDIPFLFVQLPNYGKSRELPYNSYWALTRESQLRALSLPNTGMAITIDLGMWNDIHPLKKREVGERLAMLINNDETKLSSGPLYKSMSVKNDRVIIEFDNIGGGLVIKGEELKEFAIAGDDKQFVWANAKIEKNKVIVWSDKIKKPIAVRYAWSDNPDNANLISKEGMPASPFRTDNWTAK
ncbi:MAG: beta galactosidase jelly roll domain-containing protein [Marinilabiliaceae bacterium]|nr:beta galactosidase jelly roll domain-containing protein [Marinilabiliaceae bacterium]